jgi:hypothetical protein
MELFMSSWFQTVLEKVSKLDTNNKDEDQKPMIK